MCDSPPAISPVEMESMPHERVAGLERARDAVAARFRNDSILWHLSRIEKRFAGDVVSAEIGV